MNKFLIVLLCVFLCGCATGMKTEVGSPIINQENIAKIEKGKTTQEEILVLF